MTENTLTNNPTETTITENNSSQEATMTETVTIPNKIRSLEQAVNTEVLERSREIHAALVALVSGKHFFMIGSPGTAKSYLIRRIVDRIDFGADSDNAYFQWLLTKHTTPEEVFGPPSLAELEQGRYRRNTNHKLPTCKVAFLDETFKANSAILNALLTIMNERLFFNDGDAEKVDVSTIFGASNEMPEDEGLGALWDRLHFRFEVKPLQESSNFVRMLSTPRETNPEKVVTWEEITAAKEAAANVEVPTDIYDALRTLRDNLAKEGVEPTERRFMESVDIIKAEAYLSGRDAATVDDLRVLRNVMWSRLEDQRTVERTVLELGNPIDKEAHDILERIVSLDNELTKVINESDNPKAVAKQAVEIHQKLHRTKTKMEELVKRAEEANRESDILEAARTRFVTVAQRLIKDGFGMDAD